MIAIYFIEHIASGKKYIGKSSNVKIRWYYHRHAMKNEIRSKDCNVHLWNAAQKYGLSAFKFGILEEFKTCDEKLMSERELAWMDFYNTTNRNCGYNLRRDSSTRMIVHPETIAKMSILFSGKDNPNFENRWSDEQKKNMSDIQKERHASGKFYTESWRNAQSESSKNTWKNEELKAQMARNVSLSQRKFTFEQYDRAGNLIKTWESVEAIVVANPGYKWQNIYSVCNGYKPTYHNCIWKKIPKSTRS